MPVRHRYFYHVLGRVSQRTKGMEGRVCLSEWIPSSNAALAVLFALYQEVKSTSECRLGVWGNIYLFTCIPIDDTDIILFLFVKCEQASLPFDLSNCTELGVSCQNEKLEVYKSGLTCWVPFSRFPLLSRFGSIIRLKFLSVVPTRMNR